MRSLPKGASAELADAGRTQVFLSWYPVEDPVRAICFAVDSAGRVPSNEWLIFDENQKAPGGVIQLVSTVPGRSGFAVELDAIPTLIQRCVFAVTLEQGAYSQLQGTTLVVMGKSGEPLTFRLDEVADERALIFGELYRHQSGWNLRAIGQSFKGGFKPLVKHYSAKLDDSDRRPPSPTLAGNSATPSEASMPLPHPPEQRASSPKPQPRSAQRRSGGSRPRGGGGITRLFTRLLGWLLVIAILGAAAGVGVWFFKPEWLDVPENREWAIQSRLEDFFKSGWLDAPETIWADTRGVVQRMTSGLQPATCDWTEEQVIERYHALGENYINILNRVDQSNQLLADIRNQIAQIKGACPEALHSQSQREIAEIEQLPIDIWLKEATALNTCTGLINKRLETELSGETRPILLQRLVRESDRARNLESDLTNIARDLAYLDNKTGRLVAGFGEVLDACPL